MNFASWIDNSTTLSSPPPGSVNVLIGKKVEGPGGKWIPCATKTADGAYYSGLFQVGPGQRQVCAASVAFPCPNEALSRAIDLASSAAA
jgi:hypothetical protein